jgi:AraC-like DNA-binding protein
MMESAMRPIADSSARTFDSQRTSRLWTTDAVRPAERFSYWREVCTRAFVDLRTERAGQRPFRGSIRQRTLGDVGVSDVDSVEQRVIRRHTEISSSPRPIYFVNLQVAGTCTLTQGRQAVVQQTGDVALIDACRPFEMEFGSRFHHASYKIRHDQLRPRLADPDLAGVVARASTPMGALLAGVLREAGRAGPLQGDAAAALGDHLIGIIAVVFGAAAEAAAQAKPDLRAARRLRACGFIDRHLADPSLNPAAVAAALGVSVRYLHALFEPAGESVMSYLLRRRLERCRNDLADPARRGRTIADIAFAWGFSDLSHFGRAFKAAFGLTPRDWRSQ